MKALKLGKKGKSKRFWLEGALLHDNGWHKGHQFIIECAYCNANPYCDHEIILRRAIIRDAKKIHIYEGQKARTVSGGVRAGKPRPIIDIVGGKFNDLSSDTITVEVSTDKITIKAIDT